MIEYTNIWNGFQIRSCVYLDENYIDNDRYDIVKWQEHEPYEVIDGRTGEKKISTKSCFSIGYLIWDSKEKYMTFESCGLRYFENYEDGLNEWILNFCDRIKIERRCEE